DLACAAPTLSTVATFNGTNGKYPRAAMTFDAAGNLYGISIQGGTNSNGVIFKIASGSNTITPLASFGGGSAGTFPVGGIVFDSAGNLFGTASSGGANSDGTIIKLASGASSITTVASFNGTNGQSPYGALIKDSAGNMYGTTELGGANGDGVV